MLEFELGHRGNEGPMTRIASYGDSAAFEAVLEREGREIAAVFLEPVMGSGVVAATRDFLERVQDAAHRVGALFVLDEVISLRLGTGGLQGLLGFSPDLTMMGKIIGGGLPVGAVGGKREFMKVFQPPEPRVYHTGTFAGNPVTMAAGLVSVRELTSERIEEMDRLGARLESGLRAAAAAAGLPFSVNRTGSLLQLFFSATPATFLPVRPDVELADRFHLTALNHGLFMARRGMMALSTVLTEALVDEAAARAGAAMRDLAREPGLRLPA
jgi:glutamate-1-semialdehyde 2,1-aminomutase